MSSGVTENKIILLAPTFLGRICIERLIMYLCTEHGLDSAPAKAKVVEVKSNLKPYKKAAVLCYKAEYRDGDDCIIFWEEHPSRQAQKSCTITDVKTRIGEIGGNVKAIKVTECFEKWLLYDEAAFRDIVGADSTAGIFQTGAYERVKAIFENVGQSYICSEMKGLAHVVADIDFAPIASDYCSRIKTICAGLGLTCNQCSVRSA